MSPIRRRAVALVAALMVVVTACSDDGTPPAATNGSPGTVTDGTVVPESGVLISDFTIMPADVLIAGAKIEIANLDSFAHTFTDRGGSFSVDVPAGQTVPFTLPGAGTYTVYCKIHSTMEATLRVVNSAGEIAPTVPPTDGPLDTVSYDTSVLNSLAPLGTTP